MYRILLNFLAKDDDGAVTVDWVVLSAGVVILAVGAIAALEGPVDALFAEINLQLVWDNISSSLSN